MKDRILEFLKTENKSSALFAEEISVQASSISHILSGRNNPSLDFVIKMLKKYPSLSTDWLLFGKGDMYRDSKQQDLFVTVTPESGKHNGPQIEIDLDNFPGDQGFKQLDESYGLKEIKSLTDKHTVRIVCFYDDDTFKEYNPAK
jgi:transcriptional regulator with XRE-family HTH domain